MKKHIRLIVVLALVFAALAVPVQIFLSRAPVLVVTDALFAALYGTSNLQKQRIYTSIRLFRQVKPVPIADGAGPDVVIVALTTASSQPFCVLFPRSHIQTVRQFHGQFPETPIVLFSGVLSTSGLPSPDDFLYIYSTDRETDLYRAGLFAGIIGSAMEKKVKQTEDQQEVARKYALWQDRFIQAAGREIFLRGLREQDPEASIVFVSNSVEMPDFKELSCVVLTGAGAEYIEKNPRIPVILFTWLDPALTAQKVLVQFDDSIWALAVPAVRMAAEGQAEGKIPSMPLIFSGKIADNNIFRELRKSAKKMP